MILRYEYTGSLLIILSIHGIFGSFERDVGFGECKLSVERGAVRE